VFLHSISTFNNEHVNFDVGNLSRLQMTILFSAIVTSIQDFDAVDLNQEHGGPKHVASSECREFDTVKLDCLMVVNGLDFV